MGIFNNTNGRRERRTSRGARKRSIAIVSSQTYIPVYLSFVWEEKRQRWEMTVLGCRHPGKQSGDWTPYEGKKKNNNRVEWNDEMIDESEATLFLSPFPLPLPSLFTWIMPAYDGKR